MSSGAQSAILNFPTSGVDVFSTKVDHNVVIAGESHTIPIAPGPYTVALAYVPILSSPTTTSIPGFTEVTGAPLALQFNTTYSGVSAGLLTFNSAQAGVAVNVSYTAYGDVIQAEFINSLQSGLTAVETYVLASVGSGSFVHTSGGAITGDLTMSADLVMNGANITTAVSGGNQVGESAIPFADIYSNNINTLNIQSFTSVITSDSNIVPNASGTLNLGLASGTWGNIYADTINITSDIIPNSSGTLNLGSASLPLGTIYTDNVSSQFTLSSGANILNSNSGINNLGSVDKPFANIYADNLISSGNFILKAGDTINGTLMMMSGASITTDTSGVNNIGSDGIPFANGFFQNLHVHTLSGNSDIALGNSIIPEVSGNLSLGSPDLPFATVYADNLSMSGGSFVRVTGDRMTGDLILSGTATIFPDTSGTSAIGNSLYPFGSVIADLLVSPSLDAKVNKSGDAMTGDLTMSGSSVRTDKIYAETTGIEISGITTVLDSATSATLRVGGISRLGVDTNHVVMYANVIPNVSGSLSLGTLAMPFDNIYARNIIASGSSGEYVNISGDTMIGNLIMQSPAYIDTSSVQSSGTLTLTGDDIALNGAQTITLTATSAEITNNAQTQINFLIASTPKAFIDTSGFSVQSDILANTSGTFNIGSASSPFAAIYADSIISSGTSGEYVNITGDTMTGDLIMSGVSILDSTSLTGGDTSIAFGSGCAASGLASQAFGYQTKAIGNYSHAEGNNTEALGNNSHAEGYYSNASGNNSHAEGAANALGVFSHAEAQSNALGSYSHAEGSYTEASGTDSHAEGNTTFAYGPASHAEGNNTKAIGYYSHAEGGGAGPGAFTIASGAYSHAEGLTTHALGNYSHAEGSLTMALGINSHTEGNDTRAFGDMSHAEGFNTVASGISSHAEGYYTIASGISSHAEGRSCQALGYTSHAEGESCQALGYTSHAEGINCIASGNQSHAQNYGSEAYSTASTAMGYASIVLESSDFSLAGGNQTIISGGAYAIAYGNGNLSTRDGVAVFGADNEVYGAYGFSAGINNTIYNGDASVAIGRRNVTSGINAVAIGFETQALSNYAHAQGYGSIASGITSFAAGVSGNAFHNYSTVICDFSGATSTVENQMTLAFHSGVVIPYDQTLVLVSSGNVAWRLGVHDDGTLFTVAY